jgi:hypothetical protein
MKVQLLTGFFFSRCQKTVVEATGQLFVAKIDHIGLIFSDQILVSRKSF